MHHALHRCLQCCHACRFHKRAWLAQAVVVTDPYLIAEVLGKDTEIEKSVEGVYSKFNMVSSRAVCCVQAH